MNEQEQRIKEQRTIEATQKGYMGFNGKFGVILRNLGEPLIAHQEGGMTVDRHYMDSPYDQQIDPSKARSHDELLKSIPVEDMGLPEAHDGDGPWTKKPDHLYRNRSVHHLGWRFDGLSRGMHLEIIYKEDQSSLLVTYKGYDVYKEVAGDLRGFAPLDEWEKWIESLYKAASTKEKKARRLEAEESLEEATKDRLSWIQKIRLRWGI